MEITALLSWYDEPDFLYDTVRSLEGTACGVIALDGAYSRFPGGTNRSPDDQHGALHEAALDAGLGLHSEVPPDTFYGDEVEKRTTLFDLAWHHAPYGWWLVIDSDSPIHTPDPDLENRLENTDLEAGRVYLMEAHLGLDTDAVMVYAQVGDQAVPSVIEGRYTSSVIALFKAQPIEVIGNHHSYRTLDGRYLWGHYHEPALDTALLMDHRTRERNPERRERAAAYYQQRDAGRWEHRPYDNTGPELTNA